MNTLFVVLALLCLLAGLLGSIIPALPGPPLSWTGLFLLSFSDVAHIDPKLLVIYAIVAAVITVLDYVIPSLGTKKFGGTKAGVWGCNIGLIVAVFGLPFIPIALPAAAGIVVWPFLGAYIGERINNQEPNRALKAAFGAFVGFLTGTFIKLVYAIVVIVVAVKAIL